jgi:hypothetical protein
VTPVRDEVVTLDEALVWLTVHELAADAGQRLKMLRDREGLIRLAYGLARAVRLEIAIVDSREAAALREILAVIEVALRGVDCAAATERA